MPTIQTTDKLDPREAILRAAADRILHYGYNKTTMSEIAADCGMSAGNIYRFYPSKIDIAEAMRFIASCPERRDQLVKAGLENARRFDWSRNASQVMQTYLN